MDVLTATEQFYRESSPTSWVPAYLHSRGLGQSSKEVGHAPPGWTTTTDHLKGLGFSDEDIIDAGVGRRGSRGNVIDVIRDRATVAIRDVEGNVIGFTARRAPTAAQDQAKWINTSATTRFAKSEALLGIERVGRRTPLLVEGAFDVVAVDAVTQKIGVAPVAACGTALTGDQVQMLMQLAPNGPIALGYDADPAGSKAALRAWEMITDAWRDEGRTPPHVMVARWPQGMDPAAMLEAGRAGDLRRALMRMEPMAHRASEIRLEQRHRPLDLDHAGATIRYIQDAVARDVPRLTPRPSTLHAWGLHLAQASGIEAQLVMSTMVDAMVADVMDEDVPEFVIEETMSGAAHVDPTRAIPKREVASDTVTSTSVSRRASPQELVAVFNGGAGVRPARQSEGNHSRVGGASSRVLSR